MFLDTALHMMSSCKRFSFEREMLGAEEHFNFRGVW